MSAGNEQPGPRALDGRREGGDAEPIGRELPAQIRQTAPNVVPLCTGRTMRQVAPGARKELRSGTETAASSLMAILLGDPFGIAPRSGQLIGVDVRSPKVLATGLRLAMDLIEPAAAKHDRVHLRFMPGHHAPEATVAFPVLYAGSPHVTVDDDPGFHRHGRFGTVRLGATHDHSIKPGRMAMMLATDWPEDGGATRRKPNVFCHLHREPAHEVGPRADRDLFRSRRGSRRRPRRLRPGGTGPRYPRTFTERGAVGRHRVNLSTALASAA